MIEWLALIIFCMAGMVIVYHHIGYPVALKLLTQGLENTLPNFYQRHHQITPLDHMLPSISLIMPAYNEAGTIQEKIRNLAALDYPDYKLKVILVCDGCTDGTAQLAKETLTEPECNHLNLAVVEKSENGGKVAVLNEAISLSRCSVVALSDVSSLLSNDSLLIVAAHLSNENTGVICGSYHFLKSLSVGEQAYWQYQRSIKTRESTLGATLGVHGAFYAFRRELFDLIPADTINDDFTLPVQITMKGYRCLYDPRIIAMELEQACNEMDFQRRKRIAAGNIQQAIRHAGLLHPKFGKIAFNFFSGKFLRPFMPLFLFMVLASSALLSLSYPVFQIILAIQLGIYGITVFYIFRRSQPDHKKLRVLFYLVSGHLAMAIGLINYLSGQTKGQWKRVTTET
ncbi:glycosyltransferase family 2 protein [Endozoicomonas sp. YOMI1]|uniref:glycosyltransferase family 2 protein n=1 Tax=Endozoicomonas sp. YOMI1 TaxID=2828739 RepID=UPI0021496385|nr:glycosyltransferase family 2 protein [Endozoicomonas sp. YOMI1]